MNVATCRYAHMAHWRNYMLRWQCIMYTHIHTHTHRRIRVLYWYRHIHVNILYCTYWQDHKPRESWWRSWLCAQQTWILAYNVTKLRFQKPFDCKVRCRNPVVCQCFAEGVYMNSSRCLKSQLVKKHVDIHVEYGWFLDQDCGFLDPGSGGFLKWYRRKLRSMRMHFKF